MDNSYELLKKLKAACGYWQNGSETLVTISQDDATRSFIIKVGETTYVGNCLEDVLNKLPSETY